MGKRKDAVDDAIAYGYIAEGEDLDFTCDNCIDCSTCLFAFDLYNIDGDCLMEK